MTTLSRILPTSLALAALASTALAADLTRHDPPLGFDLSFRYHVADDVAEQDVFIEREPGSGAVWRPTPAERNLDAPLYAAAEPQPHMPFDPEAIGPFEKGAPLGMTLGEWYGATGEGRYTCEAGEGRLAIDFEGLVPDGIYTLWLYFVAWPPTEPFIGTYDLPVGSRDGAQSVFVADAEGTARFDQTFKPCLQMSGEHLAAGLAVNWHSDGKTYGVEPGAFAQNAHIQLYAGLPARPGL
ncbi:MAG: hypothetical protein AAF074_14580 [Pseudomonadota bacterium]